MNFLNNLEIGLRAAKQLAGSLLQIVEDDDYYAPTFLQEQVARLEKAALVGGIWQPYYNLTQRVWRLFRNRGSSLCQTGLRYNLIPLLLDTVAECKRKGSYGVDGHFWQKATASGVVRDEYDKKLVIGMKGLPGQVGLGVGHRPKPGWTADPDFRQLSLWVGKDWEAYAALVAARVRA